MDVGDFMPDSQQGQSRLYDAFVISFKFDENVILSPVRNSVATY